MILRYQKIYLVVLAMNEFEKYGRTISHAKNAATISNILYGASRKSLPKKVSVKDLNIPYDYKNDPLLEKINNELADEDDEFSNVSEKFSSDNSNITLSYNDMDRGILSTETKNPKEKYQIKIVPIISVTFDRKILCWSWNSDSIWMVVPHYKSAIQHFMHQMQKYIDKLEYFRFDCVQNTNNARFDKLFNYMIDVSRYALDARD